MNLDEQLIAELFQYFALGVSGGFILYVVASLIGYGIYECMKLFKKL